MTKYVIFSGGLGNQMFQYAFLRGLIHNGMVAKADLSIFNCAKMHNGYELDKVFGIKDEVVSRKGLCLMALKFLRTYGKGIFVSTEEKEAVNPLLYDGYWQNEKYFETCKKEIRNLFIFKNIDEKNKDLAMTISSENSVSVHVRRGDYLGLASLEGICTEDYYKKAVNIIISRIEKPVFYIFSNEPEWAESHFEDYGVRYFVINYNQGTDSYKDMYLMTQCRHHILANSSFSWWGAWLGQSKNPIVIAPKKWNNKIVHLHPQLASWIML